MKYNESFLNIIKNYTQFILPRLLSVANKNGFVCPACGNGSGNDGTGLDVLKNNPQVIHCLKCGKSWNVFQLAQEVLRIDFNSAVKFCADTANISLPDSNESYTSALSWSFDPSDPTFSPTPAQVSLTDFSDFINNANSHLNDTNYWQKRGLSFETCQHFNFGFIHDWKHPDKPNMLPSPRLIIPTGDGIHSYAARRIDNVDKFKVMKAGSNNLFNPVALNSDFIILVEGELDAASIWQLGFHNVVGLGGVGNQNKFIDAIKSLANKPNFIIIALDNDDTGRQTSNSIHQKLAELNIFSVISNNIFEDYKDANALLQHDPDELKNKVNLIISSAQSVFVNKPVKITYNDSNNENNIIHLFKSEKFDAAKLLASDTLNDFLQKNEISTATVYQEHILLAAGLCYFYSNDDLDLDKTQKLFKDACKRRVKLAGSDGLEKKIKLYSKKFKDIFTQLQLKKDEDNIQLARHSLRQKFSAANNLNFPLPLDQITLPNGWEFDVDNHSIVSPDSTNDTIFNSIMLITKRFKNINSGLEKIEIATLKQHAKRWSYITTERVNIADKSKIVALSSFGLHVTSLTASKLVNYFDEFERLNYDLIPTIQMVDQSGWQNDLTFVAPNDDQDLIVDFVDKETKNSICRRYSQSGDRQPVIGLLKEVKQNDFGNTTIGSALASPFVYFLKQKNKCRNIHLHIAGKTESGKTALTALAFSLLGNPNDLPSFNATVNGLEAIFGGNHDLCAVVDDLNKAVTKNQKDLAKSLPYIFDGGGKQRSKAKGGLRSTIHIRGSLLTTGERTITDDSSNGGAMTRVLQLISSSDKIISDTLSRKIYNVTSSNYGLFLNDWIDFIKNNKDKMITYFDRLIHGHNGSPGWQDLFSDKSFNHIDAIAAITIANIFFDIHFLGINENEAIIKNQESAVRILDSLPDRVQIADHVRVQPKIRDWLNMFDNNFIHVDKDGEYLPAKSFNATYGIKHKDYVAIYKEAFDNMIRSFEFSPEIILRQLISCGFIRHGDGKNLLCKVSVDKDPSKPRQRMIKILNYSLENIDKLISNPVIPAKSNNDNFQPQLE